MVIDVIHDPFMIRLHFWDVIKDEGVDVIHRHTQVENRRRYDMGQRRYLPHIEAAAAFLKRLGHHLDHAVNRL